MADIHIERKRPIWPWILLGLAVLAIILWLIFAREERREPDMVGTAPPPPAAVEPVPPSPGVVPDPGVAPLPETVQPPAAVPPPGLSEVPPASLAGAPEQVNQFLRYNQDLRARQAADITHDYTADGLRQLSGALAAIAERDKIADVEVEKQIQLLRGRADSMQKEALAAKHAEQAREAMLGAVTLMQAMQEKRFPSVQQHVAEAREAATAVSADVELLKQTSHVQRFFDRAALAVRGMASGTP